MGQIWIRVKNAIANRNMEYRIIKNLLTLPSEGTFHKELNVIQWGDNEPKLDIRGWNDDHAKMTKGTTLTDEEARRFAEAIRNMQEE